MIRLYLLLVFFTITYILTGQSFKEHHVITTGSLPSIANSIMVADINNDGDQDILACSRLRNKIYLLENKGNQEFEILKELDTNLSNPELNVIKAGDLNNDGLVDIVFSVYDYYNQLQWLKNIGDNKFEYAGTLFTVASSGWRSVSFTIEDINGDNLDDIIIGCYGHNDYNLEVRLSNGDGSFSPSVSLINEGQLSFYQCTDIDNDNDIDIIYQSHNPYKLGVSINNGFGEFTEQIILDTNYQIQTYDILSLDTDGDNDIDIIGFTQSDSICIYENNGDTFFSKTVIPKDTNFILIHTTKLDFDNDGDLDLINSSMAVLENMGNNSFRFLVDYDFPFWFWECQICDLNTNDDEDIVFSFSNGAIGYIKDASLSNLANWRTLTSKLITPQYPAYELINDDEFPDICIMDYKYVFYLNNGKGGFYDTITIERLHDYSDKSVFYDINNDGFCDIISYSDQEYSGFSDSSHFKLAKNNGDNTFTRIYIDTFNNLKNKQTDFIDYNNDQVLDAIVIPNSVYLESDSIFFFKINPDFTISSYDTIISDLSFEIRNYKFYDIDKNGQNDIIINDENTLYVNYSINNHFNNTFDTIIHSEDQILDFEIANINNDTIYDVLYANAYKIVVIENYDGNSYEDLYHLEMNSRIRLLISNDLDFNGIDEIICVSLDNINVIQNIENGGYSIENYSYNSNIYNYNNSNPFIFTDIDLDGDNDLLCTYTTKSDLSWFENSHVDTIGYSSFPEKNAVWTEQNGIYEGNPSQTWTSLFVTESDTVLHNNYTYTNIYEYYLNPITFDTIRQLYSSVRQNVLTKKVYVVRHYLSETNERLLLDFNVVVGDTIILDAYFWDLDPLNTDSLYVVDSITTVFNPEERDVFHLSNHKEQTPVFLTLVEGVGSIQNPFGPPTRLVNKIRADKTELCCPEYLICMSIDNDIIYVHTDESRCNLLEVWTDVKETNQKKIFEIYPNPANDKLTIKIIEDHLLNLEVAIYDIHGKLVYQLHRNNHQNNVTVGLEKFNSGIYFLRIESGDTHYSSKFIKMK